MFILSNNCFGWFCYKYMKMQYNNPFIYTLTSYSDLKVVLTERINYANIKIEPTILPATRNKSFDLIIDNKIRIVFAHYLYDAKYTNPTKIGINVLYNKVYKYIVDKYLLRTSRMVKLTERPSLCIASDSFCGTETDRNNLIDVCEEKHIQYCTVLTPDDAIKYTGSNLVIAYTGDDWISRTMSDKHDTIISLLC